MLLISFQLPRGNTTADGYFQNCPVMFEVIVQLHG